MPSATDVRPARGHSLSAGSTQAARQGSGIRRTSTDVDGRVPAAPEVLLADFFARVPSANSKNRAVTYKGDRTALANCSRPSNKQLPPELFARNYFHAYLEYHTRGHHADKTRAFLHCKLEAERFLQHTGPWDSTIVQVTPTTRNLASTRHLFDTALTNIFSLTLKPLNMERALRAIKQNFKVYRYEAFSHGPQGLFREDIDDSSQMQRFDDPSEMGRKQGRFVLGSIVLVCVHSQLIYTDHAVYSIAKGPFKAAPDPAVASPSYLPFRTCINWAPEVSFPQVEAWWQALVSHPLLAERAEPSLQTSSFKGFDVELDNLMRSGVKIIKAALKSEYSHLRTDLEDRTVEPTPRGVMDFDESSLQRTPPESVESDDDRFDEED